MLLKQSKIRKTFHIPRILSNGKKEGFKMKNKREVMRLIEKQIYDKQNALRKQIDKIQSDVCEPINIELREAARKIFKKYRIKFRIYDSDRFSISKYDIKFYNINKETQTKIKELKNKQEALKKLKNQVEVDIILCDQDAKDFFNDFIKKLEKIVKQI